MESKIIGNKIAEARKKINISQAELAKNLFISPQAVGKWERGESFPDIVTFNRLAQILGVDLNYFSESFESKPIEPQVENKPSQSHSPSVSHSHSAPKWDLSRGNWVDADFSGLKNLNEKFSSSNMQRCIFIGSDLTGLLLKSNNIDRCDFRGSNISFSQIQSSYLVNNQFQDCSFINSEFNRCHINACDLTGANFNGAKFKGCSLTKNIIANADWKSTSFKESELVDMVFDGVIEDCYFEHCDFSRVTFQNATLINTFFKCDGLKRTKFIDCKADRMTYEFLKNGKADLTGISLLPE